MINDSSFYFTVPQQYGAGYPQSEAYNPQSSYPVVILELAEDVDFDQYPHTEPLCLPDWYYRSKYYVKDYPSYSYGYGYGGQGGQQGAQQQPQQHGQDDSNSNSNDAGADRDLECWVVGYQNAPVEKIEVSYLCFVFFLKLESLNEV